MALTWKTKSGEQKKFSELPSGYLVNIKKHIEKSSKWREPIKSVFIKAIQTELDLRDAEAERWFNNFMKPFIDKAKQQVSLTKRINPVTKKFEMITSHALTNYEQI